MCLYNSSQQRPAGEKCFMSCINSLSQADIGLSQKVMRNAKTFYHNSTIGASGTCITFVKLYIGNKLDINVKRTFIK